jgi:hypothetical protein
MKTKTLGAKTFDRKFDHSEEIIDRLDLNRARRLGVTRQSLIKLWLADRLSHPFAKEVK